MAALISIILFIIFLSISLIHVYWAFGGSWGITAALPTKIESEEKLIKPGFLMTIFVAFVFLSFAFLVISISSVMTIEIPLIASKYGLWFVASIFSLRALGDFNYVGFFKKIKQTKFAKYDSMYFSPLCLLVAILTIILEFIQLK